MFDFLKAPGHKINRLKDILHVLSPAEHHLGADDGITGFTLDSRQVKPGNVFVALPGARVDGHEYVEQARANGAGAFLVSSLEKIQNPEGCILVEDTANALGYLAAAHRRALPTKIVGITGSVGKTTTKEILAALLGGVFRTQKSAGNFNSTLGLPVQILKLRENDQWMVAEMGMSFPGEIAALTKMVKPDIGLWTAVQAVHLANFESIEGIARAKAELVDHLEPERLMIYNRDDELVTRFSAHYPGKRLGYGVHHPDAEIRACIEPYPDWWGTHFTLSMGSDTRMELYLPLVGRFNVFNALAAAAAAAAAGVPPAELKYSLKTVKPTKGRSSIHDYQGNVILVDDSYNANPHAVRQVLRSFAVLSPKTWRWLVLGDMLELGPEEQNIHRDMGRELAQYGFDRITLVGDLSGHAYEALIDAGLDNCIVEHYPDAATAVSRLSLEVPQNARIWVKGSRSIRLEKVVDALKLRLDDHQR